MNKKILISLSVIAAVATIVVGGTVAYFSDTETSTGNTFTAGTIDLQIDNQCSYNGGVCPWTLSEWALTDLEDGVHKFFNFSDIKPGAWGEDTISLHLYDNPAWVWLKIDSVENHENGCSEPEGDVDATCGDPVLGEGELYSNLHFLIWMDDGDNLYEAGEKKLHDGEVLADCEVFGLDPENCDPMDPLNPCDNYYVGMKWCFGTFDSNYNCNGVTIGNESQGDDVTMDISFVAIQTQNNPNAQGGPVCQ